MKKVVKPVPVQVKCETFTDVIKRMQEEARKEQEKFEAMTPDEQVAYIAQREKDMEEAMKIAAQLPGLTHFWLK